MKLEKNSNYETTVPFVSSLTTFTCLVMPFCTFILHAHVTILQEAKDYTNIIFLL